MPVNFDNLSYPALTSQLEAAEDLQSAIHLPCVVGTTAEGIVGVFDKYVNTGDILASITAVLVSEFGAKKVSVLDGMDYSPKEYADKVCEVRATKSEDYVLVANLIGAGEEYYEKLVAALTDNPFGATIFIAL